MRKEFQAEACVPIGIAERKEIAAPVGACVVHQDVEPAEMAFGRGGERVRCAVGSEVGSMDFGAAPETADGMGHVRQRLPIARRQQEVAAGGGKLKRDRLADAATGAGDERNLAAEFGGHDPRLACPTLG